MQLDTLGQDLEHPGVLAHGGSRIVEADAQRAPVGQHVGQGEQGLAVGLGALDLGRHLLLGLLDVAEIGGEAADARAEQGDPVRPGEPGRVAQADHVDHHERVQLALGQRLVEPLQPGGDAHDSNSFFSRSSAIR
jgi:hypothetical protein